MNTIFSSLFFSVISFPFYFNSNPSTQKEYGELLQKWKQNNPQEKVFIQTDRQAYTVGETIWMKAWCMLDEAPTYLSKILYVDLTDATGKVIIKKMYKLDSLGTTPADMDIPEDVLSGNYTINAYTLWMKNFNDYIFSKHIYIYSNDYKQPQKRVPKIKVDFFPEGGYFIEGLQNRIAFKITDEEGLPLNVNGNITDEKDQIVASLKIEHDGMGSFEITPQPQKKYKAVINTAAGTTLDFNLPDVSRQGISLRIENANPNRLFVLVDKQNMPDSIISIVAQMNGNLVYQAKLNVNQDQKAASIPKKDIPGGILHITAFDENHLPLAERICFIENYTINKPTLLFDTISLKKREKNVITFKMQNLPALYSMSALVTSADDDSTTHTDENIASYFLASSDIKGTIYHPGYYFKDKTPEILKHLDLLMMTHGWRRFEWKKIITEQYDTLHYPVESGIVLKGKVTKSDRKVPITQGKVSFIIKGEDSTKIMSDAYLTDKGEFIVNNLDYQKSASIFYMGTNQKTEGLVVDVNLYDTYIDTLKKSMIKNAINADTINILNKNNVLANHIYNNIYITDTLKNRTGLPNVIVKGKKISPVDSLRKEYVSAMYDYGSNIDPNEYKNYMTIWQIMQASIPGITIQGDPFNPTVTMNRFNQLDIAPASSTGEGIDNSASMNNGYMADNGIVYFLNEINVGKDVVNSITPDDVSLIKVLKNEAAILGISGGAIMIYTKKRTTSSSRAIYEKSFTTIKRAGYSIARTFFSPVYSNTTNTTTIDDRPTLYWNASVRLNQSNQFKIKFYNSDMAKKVKLTIQGIDVTGNFILTEYLIR